MVKKNIYSKPIIEILIIDFKTSVANSASGIGLGEEIWGDSNND